MRGALAFAVVVAATAIVGVPAAGSARGLENCQLAGGGRTVCLGTLPPERVRVVLRSRNGSRERGVAFVKLGLHETTVAIRLSGAPKGVAQPARLRRGGCGSIHPADYELGNVVDGRRKATLAEAPYIRGYALTVHETAAEGAPVVACGVIPPRR